MAYSQGDPAGPGSQSEVVLSATLLRKRFSGGEAVHGITMELRAGEVVGLVGPNGAGKTTLLNLLGGLLYPSAGHVTVFGLHRWRESFAIRRRSFMLPVDCPVGAASCPFEFLRFVAQAYGVPREEFREKLARLAADMRYTDHLVKTWPELSLGMTKKAGLIAAFLAPVRLRLLDEPFAGGIDPFAMEILYSWMDEARGRGETTVFSTQVLDQAEIVCDRVAMMDHGKMVIFDAPEVIMARAGVEPNSPRAFAQAFFRLTGRTEE